MFKSTYPLNSNWDQMNELSPIPKRNLDPNFNPQVLDPTNSPQMNAQGKLSHPWSVGAGYENGSTQPIANMTQWGPYGSREYYENRKREGLE